MGMEAAHAKNVPEGRQGGNSEALKSHLITKYEAARQKKLNGDYRLKKKKELSRSGVGHQTTVLRSKEQKTCRGSPSYSA